MKKLSLLAFAAILAAMTANAQTTFTPDEKGEVSPVTPEVLTLMKQAEQIIAESASKFAEADKKVFESTGDLMRVIANKKASTTEILGAQTEYLVAVDAAMSARSSADGAVFKTTMAYFDNVIAITNAKFKLSKNSYGEWQKRTLAITRFPFPPETKILFDDAEKAIQAAKQREAEFFRQLEEDFNRMEKRIENLLRKDIPKI